MVDLHYARGLGRNRLGNPPLGCKHWPGMSKTTGKWIHRSKSTLHTASAASFWFCSKYPISHKSATNMFFWLVKMLYLITNRLLLILDNFNDYNKPWNSSTKILNKTKKYQRNKISKLNCKKKYRFSSDNFFCFISFSSPTYSYALIILSLNITLNKMFHFYTTSLHKIEFSVYWRSFFPFSLQTR